MGLFAGNICASRILKILGRDRHLTLCHFSLMASFISWGLSSCRRNSANFFMSAVLSFQAISVGKDATQQGILLARAGDLGLGRGEAGGAAKVLGSIVRIVTPLILSKIYTTATTSKSRWRLPSGS